MLALLACACNGRSEDTIASATASAIIAIEPSCESSPPVRSIGPPRTVLTFGGRLATNLQTGARAGSYYKTFWAIRDAPVRPALTLVATSLGTNNQQVTFTGQPSTPDDESGLWSWGPTYYADVLFPTAGCWAIAEPGANMSDRVVLLVLGPSSP